MTSDDSRWLKEVVGETIGGRYQVEKLIGTGGMGAVFQATHRGMGRRVALKFLTPQLRQHPKAIIRFQQEARAATATNRRGVVDVLDYDVDAKHGPYLVMELLEGESLQQYIYRRRRVAPHKAVTIATEILETLEAVHAHDIVHRDLKPANIFLATTEEGERIVKVLDFGISQVATVDLKTKLTAPGIAVGTPRYMAPEQAQCSPDVDHRADLYSVGAILYEALSGVKPYNDVAPGQVLAEVVLHPTRPLREVAPGIEVALYDIIERAMQRAREDRYQTTREMIEALNKALLSLQPAREDVSEAPLAAATTVDDRERARARTLPAVDDVPSWPDPGQSVDYSAPDTVADEPRQAESADPQARSDRQTAAPKRRGWLIALLAVAGLLALAGIIFGGLFLGGVFDARTPAATPQAQTPVAGGASGTTPALPGAGAASAGVVPQGQLPPAAPTASPLELALRADLEAATRHSAVGQTANAKGRLLGLVNRAVSGGVVSETSEARVTAEAHLRLAKLLVAEIVLPPPPRSDIGYSDTVTQMTAPYSEAIQHSTKATTFVQALTPRALLTNAEAVERLGETHLEMYGSPAYRTKLSQRLIEVAAASGRGHLQSALSQYDSAARFPDPSQRYVPAARAGHSRVAQRLAGLSF